jgi:hypothetical protein
VDLDGDGRRDILNGPLSCTRIWVDDVDSDGKLDILVGDLVTLVSPADKVGEGDFTQILADWKKAMDKASKERDSAGNDRKKQDEAYWRFDKIYNQRSEFMKDEQTGFVWLYARK